MSSGVGSARNRGTGSVAILVSRPKKLASPLSVSNEQSRPREAARRVWRIRLAISHVTRIS
jgi:hypothetical protein